MRDDAHKETRAEKGFSRKTKDLETRRLGSSFQVSQNCMSVPRGRKKDGTNLLSLSLSLSTSPFREVLHAKFFVYNR